MDSQVKSGLTFSLADVLNKQFAKSQQSGVDMLSSDGLKALKSEIDSRAEELVEAQAEYCRSRGIPNFSMGRTCMFCGSSLVAQYGDSMRTELISGCRVCCRSFCE